MPPALHAAAPATSPLGRQPASPRWSHQHPAPSAPPTSLAAPPPAAPYWVFGLGPATYGNDGQYQWALVSDSLNLSLFVLARNVTDYFANYDAGVQATLKATGFTNFLNSPIMTVQANCTYW